MTVNETDVAPDFPEKWRRDIEESPDWNEEEPDDDPYDGTDSAPEDETGETNDEWLTRQGAGESSRRGGIARRSWDDIGNAERLVDHFGGEVRFAIDAEQWITYEGGRWLVKGAATKVWQRVVTTIEQLPRTEALLYPDVPKEQESQAPAADAVSQTKRAKKEPTEREEFLAWVKQQRMRGRLAAMREIAQSRGRLHCEMSIFDRPEMLLNVANGVVDLTTGRLWPHNSRLYLMQQSPVRFDPDAKCPRWEQFLDSVMPDPERRAYLARIVGYTLTAATHEQAMFIHHGEGQNGKGVFMRVLMSLFGDYAQSVPRSTLLAKQGEGIPNDIARMMGKRLLATTETSAGKRLDDELVKQLTGEDTVSARYLNKEFFDFRPVGKIHLATNYLPHVGGGHGIARRLQDIGWDVTVPPESRVANLDGLIMQTEAAGVLNWAIQGCMDWQQQGLAVPEAVMAKTQKHLADSDPLGMWFAECAEKTQSQDIHTEVQTLFASYREFCRSGELRPMTIKSFSDTLVEKGFRKGNHPKTRRSIFFGVQLSTL